MIRHLTCAAPWHATGTWPDATTAPSRPLDTAATKLAWQSDHHGRHSWAADGGVLSRAQRSQRSGAIISMPVRARGHGWVSHRQKMQNPSTL